MKYGIIKNGQIDNNDVLSDSELRVAFSNVSLPEKLNANVLKSLGVVELNYPTIPEDMKETSDKIIKTKVVNEDGVFKRVAYLADLSPKVANARRLLKMNQLRTYRNMELKETDFTELPTFKGYKEYSVYREQLRTLFDDGIDPYLIEFPQRPQVTSDKSMEDTVSEEIATLKQEILLLKEELSKLKS